MLCKEFNKIGGTEFRVKNQINGYTTLVCFLRDNIKNKENIKEINEKFLNFTKREQIYSYKTEDKIQNRFLMVSKLLKQIGLIELKEKEIFISKQKIFNFLENPKLFLFNEFTNQFKFWQKGIEYLYSKKNLDSFWFSIALQIFNPKEDNSFCDVYEKVSNNFDSVIDELIFKLYETTNPKEISPKMFLGSYKKPDQKRNEIFIELLNNVMKKQKISKELVSKLSKIKLFEHMIKNKEYGYKRYKGEKRTIKQYADKLTKYIDNVNYSTLIMDMNRTKLWMNIGLEYNDLICRWLNEFSLLDNKNVSSKNISLINQKFSLIEKQNNIQLFPYSLKEVKSYLIKMQEHDFNFKFDLGLDDVTNSAIAEYFVNLFYAIHFKMSTLEFKKYSRTGLKNGTLLPSYCAPGKGPDMYIIYNNKLKIIETTIHKTKKQVMNNEIFNIVDHVNLDRIKYLTKERVEKIDSTEIILVCPLEKLHDIKEVHQQLNLIYNDDKKRCGNTRLSKVKNFKGLASNI